MDFLPLPRDKKSENEVSKERQPTWLEHQWAAFKAEWVTGDTLFGAYLAVWCIGLLLRSLRTHEEIRTPNEFEDFLISRFDFKVTPQMFRDNLWIAGIVSVAYIALITIGPWMMKSRTRPMWLKPWVFAWNVFLVVFSTAGAYSIVPCIVSEIRHRYVAGKYQSNTYADSIHNLMCHGAVERSKRYPSQYMWLCLFCASKVPEMIDTVLLVANKKNVIFLHWFHHLTVMLFCWVSWGYQTPVGIIYSGMNYTVHSLMYAWYGLASKGLKPKRLLSQTVTVLQIVQMVFGSAMAIYVAVVEPCDNHKIPIATGLFIYGSYLYLFVQFFVNAYCRKKKLRKSSKKGTSSAESKKTK